MTVRVIGNGKFSSYVASSTDLSHTVSSTWDWCVDEIRLHFTTGAVAGANTLEVKIDSGMSTELDHLIVSQDLAAVENFRVSYSPALSLGSTDSLVATWTNSSSKNYGFEVIYRKEQ